jgi:hypothetical protein
MTSRPPRSHTRPESERIVATPLGPSHHVSHMRDRALEEMANDPAIQLGLREIEAEFAVTEFDGLEAHS